MWIPRRSLALALTLSVVGACKSRSKRPAEKVPPAVVEGLAALPASARAVMGLRVSEVIHAPVVRRAVDRMFAREPDLKSDLDRMLGACQIDVEADIEQVTLALLPGDAGGDSVLVAKGKFQENLITACLSQAFQESGGRLETAEWEKRNIYHQVALNAPGVWFAFGSASTVLVASSRPALELAVGSGPKLSEKGTALAPYLERVDMSAGMWGVALLTPDVASGLVEATGGRVSPPKAMAASLDLEAGLVAKLAVEVATDEEARALAETATNQLKALALVLQSGKIGPLVDRIEIVTDASWAVFSWNLAEAELAKLVSETFAVPAEMLVEPADAGVATEEVVDNAGPRQQNPAPTSGTERENSHGN